MVSFHWPCHRRAGRQETFTCCKTTELRRASLRLHKAGTWGCLTYRWRAWKQQGWSQFCHFAALLTAGLGEHFGLSCCGSYSFSDWGRGGGLGPCTATTTTTTRCALQLLNPGLLRAYGMNEFLFPYFLAEDSFKANKGDWGRGEQPAPLPTVLAKVTEMPVGVKEELGGSLGRAKAAQ